MEVGRVAGAVWATRKAEGLEGRKLLLVQRWDVTKNSPLPGPYQVAADTIGAGVGEKVLLVTGSAARRAVGEENAPVDGAVVAILDGWEAKE